MAWSTAGMAWIDRVFDDQRGALFPWTPVFLAVGIGFYFALPVEPTLGQWAGLAALAVVLTAVAGGIGMLRFPPLVAAILVVTGILLAGVRAHVVAEPVLTFRYYGPIEGRIVAIDRSVGDRVRLTLDRVVLEDMRPGRVPTRVRVSLHSDPPGATPQPGLRVAVTGHLSPPAGPVEPGGFDFQRIAWFDGLGAIGYARAPLVALAPAPEGAWLARVRGAISAQVRAHLPGEPGAFAAALTTGDRSAMGKATLADLRASNLAHLLAISGLHMGLLTAFVFGALRLFLVSLPGVALTLPVKKIAACGALIAASAYLALSGGNVATQRAFVMVAVMLVAVLLDRRALTLRAVALAALIVLLLRPESLPEPGFQMSFAATVALVAVFRVLRDLQNDRVPRALRPALATVISSAVAGAATAPVAAVHFNTIAHYGLLANLVSVPLMGTIVMPGAVLAACLAPFGLEEVGLAIMEPALRWILSVAHWIASQDGAVGRVAAPGAVVLPILAGGGLWIALWRGPARLIGVAPIALGFVLWAGAERPGLLVSDSGGLIGVMTAEGRALNKPRGEGFVALSWLENDGDAADQPTAAARGLAGEGSLVTFTHEGGMVAHLRGRGAAGRIDEACASAPVVILAALAEAPPPKGCLLFDQKSLTRAGGGALVREGAGVRLISARAAAGKRLWNNP